MYFLKTTFLKTSLFCSLPCLVDKYSTRNPSLICEQIGSLVIVFAIFQKPSCQDVSNSISDEQSSISSIPANTTDLFQDALVNYYSHLMNQVHQNIVQMGILRVLQNQQGKYRIRVNAAPGFYFSIWVFGWGLIQKVLQKVDFLSKKWGCIQEKPQKLDFSQYLGLNSRVGLQ